MKIRLDLALVWANHRGKKVLKKDLAKAMWPESRNPTMNLWNFEQGKTQKITIEQIEAIMRLTGVPIQTLIQ